MPLAADVPAQHRAYGTECRALHGRAHGSEGSTVRSVWPTVRSEGSTVRSVWPTVRSEGSMVRSVWPTVRSEGPTVRSVGPTLRSEGSTVRSVWPTVRSEGPTVRSSTEIMYEHHAQISVTACVRNLYMTPISL